MARYLIVAHQTSASEELIAELRAVCAADGQAEFTLLVPATPASDLLTWEEGETREIAYRHAQESRARLEQAGIQVKEARVGDYLPLDAIRDELGRRPGYAGIILSTFPPGMSRWLRVDLPTQVRRSFPKMQIKHVLAQPRARVPVADPASSGTRQLTDDQP